MKELSIFAIIYNLVRLVMWPSAMRQPVSVARLSCLDARRWLGARARAEDRQAWSGRGGNSHGHPLRQVARSSSGLQETLTTLRESCRHIPDATLREMTLDTFAKWYTENAQKQPPDRFDLQIVECSLDSLHDQIWAYHNAFHPDKDWNQIVAESAMGALTWAR